MAEHHSSSSEPERETRSQLLEHFDDIFSCAICLMKLDNPHLCPQCSTLYCYDCISEWLQSKSEQHLYCPNCKYELQLDKLVKVRWFEEADKIKRKCIKQTANTSNNKETNDVDEASVHSNGDAVKKDSCSNHLRDIRFYCCTCKLCVCDTCILEDENHVAHTFKSLNVIYESDLQVANQQFEKVTARMENLEPLINEVDRNVQLVKTMLEKKLQEVQSFTESVTEELKVQAIYMLQKLQKHKSALTAEMKNIEQSLELMKGEVKTSSQPQFIAKKSRIIRECNKILEKPIKDLKEMRVPINFKIDIPLIYETGILVIENYSSFLNTKYIDPVDIPDNFGHIWRIYVECHASEGELGIFLELVKGLPCRVDFHLQLLHADPERIIQRNTTFQFDHASSLLFVYPNFIPLKTISDGNYLKYDSLEFSYQIRPNWKRQQ